MHDKCNEKGGEEASINLCLEMLKTDYVNLMLIHNPASQIDEYKAASTPHFLEKFNHMGKEDAIKPLKLIDGDLIRPLIISARLAVANKSNDAKYAKKERIASWRAMEKALKEGKAKMIGVSNYPAELLLEMEEYAEVMPAVN